MSHALILCAGASMRMGMPKALCSLGNQTLLARILDTLAQSGDTPCSIKPIVVVAEPHGHAICSWLSNSRFQTIQVVWNQQPSDGMLSSIQQGLRALPTESIGTLLWPVDVPLVGAQTIQTLMQHTTQRWLVPTFDDRGGHPVWLPRALCAEVLSLPIGSSLRTLRQTHPPLRVAVDDPEIVLDIDTPEALEQAALRLRR
ncbi:MAG: nucleotidyltransferase family protein [Myxococcales bacterium]|nr:nucleotidyltransferase family protein [Myxococcales bacterium]